MAQFNFSISSSPMAEKVDGMTASVGVVGAAVATLQNEVIKAEQEAAENISNNVTYGFYMLTRNQFSQKLIAFENESLNILMVINKYMSELEKINSRMEKDYNMISSQYIKVFKKIEAKLDEAIKALDRPLMDIVVSTRNSMVSRRLVGISSVINNSFNLPSTATTLTLVKLRELCLSLIFQLKNNLFQSRELHNQFVRILGEQYGEDKIETIYIPVIVSESDSIVDSQNKRMVVHLPDFVNSNNKFNEIQDNVVDKYLNSESWGKSSGNEKTMVNNHYSKMLDGMDTRKKKIMQQLFDASDWDIFKE